MKDKVVEEAYELSQRLIADKVPHWLTFGALIGAMRDGQRVPWDCDIDFVIWEAHSGPFRRISGFKSAGGRHPFCFSNLPKGNIDFYFMHRQGSNAVCTDRPAVWWKVMQFDGHEQITLCDRTFPVPRYTEAHIESVYGADWRTPKQEGFCGPAWADCPRMQGTIPPRLAAVYVTGVFDLFHVGHLNLLRKARELFDEVVVGVMPDGDAESYKRPPIMNYAERAAVVRACRYVDRVVRGRIVIDDAWLDDHHCDYAIYGDGQLEKAHFDWMFPGLVETGRLHRVPRYEGLDTTEIIERCKS